MKKLFLAILLVSYSTLGNAQSFSIGPKAGVNFSSFTGGNFNSKALVGYHLGGMANVGFGEVFSIQLETLFSTQGAEIRSGGFKQKVRTNYITIPTLLKFKANNGLFLELGPQIGFKTKENNADQTIKNFSRNLDLSAAAGLGIQSKSGVGLGARYIAGLSKVGDFSGSNINPDFKNSVIQVSLFWLW